MLFYNNKCACLLATCYGAGKTRQARMIRQDRIEVTATKVACLTLGSWKAIAPGFEVTGYCPACDDADATLVVADYYLSIAQHGVVAEVACQHCGEKSTCTDGIMNPRLIRQGMAMRPKKR